MDKEFISYEEALILKELGFNEPCFGYYRDSDGQLFPYTYYEGQFDDLTLAPLYQQAFRWFDENYPRYTALLDAGHNERFSWKILDDGDEKYGYESEPSDSRLDVELACLRKLIEIVNK